MKRYSVFINHDNKPIHHGDDVTKPYATHCDPRVLLSDITPLPVCNSWKHVAVLSAKQVRHCPWRHRQCLLGKLLHFSRNYFVSTGALADGMYDVTHSWLTDHKHSSRKSTLKSLVPLSNSLEAKHLILVWIMKVKGPKNQADFIEVLYVVVNAWGASFWNTWEYS